MKKQTTKVQQGAGVLKTSIPKTICDLFEIEKGDTLNWKIKHNHIITLTKEDENE